MFPKLKMDSEVPGLGLQDRWACGISCLRVPCVASRGLCTPTTAALRACWEERASSAGECQPEARASSWWLSEWPRYSPVGPVLSRASEIWDPQALCPDRHLHPSVAVAAEGIRDLQYRGGGSTALPVGPVTCLRPAPLALERAPLAHLNSTPQNQTYSSLCRPELSCPPWKTGAACSS
jgi:hypothetical protein